MEQKKAISILVNVAGAAQKAGILSLQDASVVLAAINAVTQDTEPTDAVGKVEDK